ncbi:MAG: Lipopolysaccharide export system ATP-binding protein LptB [Candidatus Latescibacteria bacterium ADurb.Bin168]|nr:MAG: Lipopolysaccharide export system ATP-binding protein LptB [Candidatus Latescibacteria bacterium ADurb.Bin168]
MVGESGTRSSLRAEGLSKRYGGRLVVDHVSLTVKRGETVGLLGPNGAGKTTTFYMLLGMVVPEEGRVYLEEQEITKLPMYRRARLGIGYLSQERSVFRKMTVEQNILAILERLPLTREERMRRLEEILDELDIARVRKTRGEQLSGGECRRTEIARALVIEPKFLLLDEPFSGIDPIAVEDIQSIIARLQAKGLGILITDHNVHGTLAITDHAYVMAEGGILCAGTPAELADNELARKFYLGERFRLN